MLAMFIADAIKDYDPSEEFYLLKRAISISVAMMVLVLIEKWIYRRGKKKIERLTVEKRETALARPSKRRYWLMAAALFLVSVASFAWGAWSANDSDALRRVWLAALTDWSLLIVFSGVVYWWFWMRKGRNPQDESDVADRRV